MLDARNAHGPASALPGAPRPWTFDRSRQVSWLAGRGDCRAFPGASAPVARLTAALRLQLRGQPRRCRCRRTGFPLSLGNPLDVGARGTVMAR